LEVGQPLPGYVYVVLPLLPLILGLAHTLLLPLHCLPLFLPQRLLEHCMCPLPSLHPPLSCQRPGHPRQVCLTHAHGRVQQVSSGQPKQPVGLKQLPHRCLHSPTASRSP
jgi:hypothetical protein